MSENNIIYFTVIALNKHQADEVILKLKEEKQDDLAEWLGENKELIYGEYAEEWKPFKEDTLEDIICADSNCYESETELIRTLNPECTNILSLSHVRVFFIDIFTIYIDQFEKFATRADLYLTNDTINNCCFLINYELPIEGQKHLERKFKEIWPTLSVGYKNGGLHRVSVRADDVRNFKNYLKRIILEGRDKPDPDSDKAAEKFLGYSDKERPIFKWVEK